MKRPQNVLVFLIALAMTLVPYSAFAFIGLDAGVGYWQQTPSGTLAYKPLTASDQLDLKNDMHLSDEGKPFVRVKAELPLILPNLYFMATPMSFEGSGPITRSITYGGQTFTAGVPVQTKLTLDHYDLALFYPIPLLKTATAGILNVELGLNARMINFDGTISQDTLGYSAAKKLTLFVPMIYAGVQLKPIDLFSIEAEIRGIAYGENHYYDYIGRLKISPIPVLYIAGGYRAEEVKIDQSDVKTDIKFSGPFAEVGVSF